MKKINLSIFAFLFSFVATLSHAGRFEDLVRRGCASDAEILQLHVALTDLKMGDLSLNERLEGRLDLLRALTYATSLPPATVNVRLLDGLASHFLENRVERGVSLGQMMLGLTPHQIGALFFQLGLTLRSIDNLIQARPDLWAHDVANFMAYAATVRAALQIALANAPASSSEPEQAEQQPRRKRSRSSSSGTGAAAAAAAGDSASDQSRKRVRRADSGSSSTIPVSASQLLGRNDDVINDNDLDSLSSSHGGGSTGIYGDAGLEEQMLQEGIRFAEVGANGQGSDTATAAPFATGTSASDSTPSSVSPSDDSDDSMQAFVSLMPDSNIVRPEPEPARLIEVRQISPSRRRIWRARRGRVHIARAALAPEHIGIVRTRAAVRAGAASPVTADAATAGGVAAAATASGVAVDAVVLDWDSLEDIDLSPSASTAAAATAITLTSAPASFLSSVVAAAASAATAAGAAVSAAVSTDGDDYLLD